MLRKSRAVVLRIQKYNDEKLIAELLTEQCGVVAFALRYARSPRAAVKHTLFRPLAVLDVEWDHRATGGLQRLRSAQVAVPLTSLPYDAGKTAIALFLAEFLHYAVRAEEAPGLLFDYVARSVEWLDAADSGWANFHLVFMLRLARFLGFEPNLEGARPTACFDLVTGCFSDVIPAHCHYIAPAEAARLPLLMRMNFGTMHLFRFSGTERSRLLACINSYYSLHLPDFPELKSLAVLREIF